MDQLASALVQVMTPVPFLWLLLGVSSGIFVGAIPGLGGGMLITLVLPLTFTMDSTNALIMMIGMYVGSVSGGLISATLLRMPGTPSSVVTTFDGYPMAQKGEPGRALGLGIGSSVIGGLISGFFLVVLSPPLSIWALSFGPWEYFTMIMMGMILIASISKGSMAKGLLAGALGMTAAMPGLNESDGQLRLTYGFTVLSGGFNLLPVLLGIFVMSQILKDAISIKNVPKLMVSSRAVFPSWRQWAGHSVNLIRSSVVGTWIGILPGVGASISAMVSYGMAKTFSRTPEKFGTGHDEGIIASEAANNANVGGALIPLVTMGIPGSPIDAILLGALVLHQIQPGPLLFVTNSSFVWALIAAYLVANIIMFVLMTLSVKHLARVINFNRAYLLPAIFVFCLVGAYSLTNRMFDVWVVLGFGVVGFMLDRAKVPLGPFVIGFVLAGPLEAELRSGLQLSQGSLMPLLTRPIALCFLTVALFTLIFPIVSDQVKKARKRNSTVEEAVQAKD